MGELQGLSFLILLTAGVKTYVAQTEVISKQVMFTLLVVLVTTPLLVFKPLQISLELTGENNFLRQLEFGSKYWYAGTDLEVKRKCFISGENMMQLPPLLMNEWNKPSMQRMRYKSFWMMFLK